MSSVPDYSIQISVDRGGSFTDLHASWPDSPGSSKRNEIILKLLSRDPGNYEDAPREGVRRVLEKILGISIPQSERFSTQKIASIRLSTTVGTNALLERRGARHALLVTRGFHDLLEIGTQARPRIFDLAIRKPDVLYEKVVEVDERCTLVGYTSDPNRRDREIIFDDNGNIAREYNGEPVEAQGKIVRGLSGEAVRILKEPDLSQVRSDLQKIYDDGIHSLAIVFMHSYTYPEHERLVADVAKKIGFKHISLSSEAMPMIKIVSRGTSSTADAYLSPILHEYIEGFFNGFDPSLREGVKAAATGDSDSVNTPHTVVEFMTSDGGLVDVSNFSGLKSILSGPAGGVVGFAMTSWDENEKIPIIGLDMGGTSTDVSRFEGRYEVVFETTTAGVTIQSPQLDINTVAAGGGSRLFFRTGLYAVGPESAGSHPGPTCYRKGGPLAVTDANLFLGRLVPDFFPRIFGPSANEPLDVESCRREFSKLANEINEYSKEHGLEVKSEDEIAWGFLTVANETMCRPIRALTEARGYDTSKNILACFGGAGGQHACAIAGKLGIKRILIHRFSSVLSAYGMSLSSRVVERQEPSSEILDEGSMDKLKAKLDKLEKQVRSSLRQQGFNDDQIEVELMLNLRYDGTDTALMTLKPADSWDFRTSFTKVYQQEFGFILDAKAIIVDDIRVRGLGKSLGSPGQSAYEEEKSISFKNADKNIATRTTPVFFEQAGRINVPVYLLQDLQVGTQVYGGALILDDTQTLVIDPGACAKILTKHVLIILK